MTDPDFDFLVLVEGAAWRFRPLTEAAKNFTGTDLQIKQDQWLGSAFVVHSNDGLNLLKSLEDKKFLLKVQ